MHESLFFCAFFFRLLAQCLIFSRAKAGANSQSVLVRYKGKKRISRPNENIIIQTCDAIYLSFSSVILSTVLELKH